MKVFFKTAIVFVVIVVVYQIFFSKKDKISADYLRTYSDYKDSIPADYLKLIKGVDNLNKIHFVNSLYSKYRNPIARCYYKDKAYIQVYKISEFKDLKLSSSVYLNFINSEAPQNEYYLLDKETNFKYQYKVKLNDTPKCDSIFLNMNGDNAHILMKNDSVQYITMDCKNFSLRFQQKSSFDIFGEADNDIFNSKMWFELLLLKKASDLYLIMLSSEKENSDIKTPVLKQIIAFN